MKKFNAIMLVVEVILMAVFGLTSCDKADDGFEQIVNYQSELPGASDAVAEEDVYLCVPATEEQMKYMDVVYTLSLDGEMVQVKMSEMTRVVEEGRLSSSMNLIDYSEIDEEDAETKGVLGFYEYNLGRVCDAKVVDVKYLAHKGKLDHQIGVMMGSAIVQSSGEVMGYINPRYYSGIFYLKGVVEYFNKSKIR